VKESNFIYGLHPLIEAIRSGKEIDKVLVKKGLQGQLASELLGLIKFAEIPYQYVPVEKLNRLSRKNHQGVIAFISLIQYQEIEQVLPMAYESGKDPLILALDGITDVRNLGAIARTAECAGVDALLIPSKGIAQINEDAIKSSAGALNRIVVCRSDDLIKSLKFLKTAGLKLIGATEKTEKNYTQCDYNVPLAIVMGSEDRGISNEIFRILDDEGKIPLLGEIGSLNVSVATGVVLFEVIRQRSDI